MTDVDESRYRASGPGGQHRNKVETGVRLVHRPTGIRAEANERRSQAQNRGMALRRLRLRLALDHRSPALGKPSALWIARTGGPSLAVNPEHADVAALLAEALDVLAAHDDDVAAAAGQLGVGTSRLLRVLKLEPAALAGVNARRRSSGRNTYR